ncbi:MAG TPA: hypothetical protein PKL65_03860 [Bacteroidales bacterium]|nr:hypothetical protein [Bacteroidales bacterium]HNR41344.1 hypothetical protein [Bacteroidales bacterium]HPM18238.1 hypothetical protein [Bacteroidales bacterium]
MAFMICPLVLCSENLIYSQPQITAGEQAVAAAALIGSGSESGIKKDNCLNLPGTVLFHEKKAGGDGRELSYYSHGQDEKPGSYRPPLFFREDWKETPAATPVNQNHVANKDLVLSLYGPGCDSIKKSHHDRPDDDPYYVWSGLCTGNWAVTLKNRNNFADLTGFSKIAWRTKQSGFRELRVILKLSDGTWLVSREGDGMSNDWRISEFNLSDLNWFRMDIDNIIEDEPVTGPDLSKVDEIGFTDLMRGGQSIACSRLDWITVYGKPVAR